MGNPLYLHGRLFLAWFFLLSMPIDPAAGLRANAAGLAALETPAERNFLLIEVVRVQPPERRRELSKYDPRQLELGGGFYGLLPEQLADPDSIPLPAD